MKLSQSRRGFLAVIIIAGACLLPSVSCAATTVVGMGPDTSYLVIESPNLGARTYEIHYTYNSSASQDGYFLLSQVVAFDSNYALSLSNYGSMASPNYIVDSISYNGVPEAGAIAPPYTPYWAHWVARGQAGFPTASPQPAGAWSFGSGLSSPYRLIAPDSWDALFFSDGSSAPSVAPVPETSSALLGLLGSLVIFKRRRA
jgi:hypothetical protein